MSFMSKNWITVHQRTLIEWRQTWCNTLHITARDTDFTCTHHNYIYTLMQLQWANLANKLTALLIQSDFGNNLSLGMLHMSLAVNNVPHNHFKITKSIFKMTKWLGLLLWCNCTCCLLCLIFLDANQAFDGTLAK